MKCEKCGREIDNKQKFCKYCGEPVKVAYEKASGDRIVCEACGARVKDGMLFCTQCGAPMNRNSAESSESVNKKKGKKKRRIVPWLILFMTVISILLIGGIVLYFVGPKNLINRITGKDSSITEIKEEKSESVESVSETEEQTVIATEPVSNDTDLLAKGINDIRNNIARLVNSGFYSNKQIESGITAYVEDDTVAEIIADRYTDNNDYSRDYYYSDGKLIFAEYVSTDLHQFFFENGKLVRWSYSQDADDRNNVINYDMENTTEYARWEQTVQNDSATLLAKLETIDEVSYDSEEYIFANSDSEYIYETDLYGLSEWELRIARNEIMARHGRLFNDTTLQTYFDNCSWYTGSIDPDSFDKNYESILNDYEKKNADMIKDYEKKTNKSKSVSNNGAVDKSFYGVWCDASKDSGAVYAAAEQMQQEGFEAAVFVTSEWSNLNRERYYAVTAGIYHTKTEAEDALSHVKDVYPDAYVKYTGDWIG